MKNAWLVRAGHGAKQARTALALNRILVNWTGTGDITNQRDAEIHRDILIGHLEYGNRQATMGVRQLIQFRDDICQGDIVVTVRENGLIAVGGYGPVQL